MKTKDFFESQVVLLKNIYLADLLGSQHLFEILQTSLTAKNSYENMVKRRRFKNPLQRSAPFFFFFSTSGRDIRWILEFTWIIAQINHCEN